MEKYAVAFPNTEQKSQEPLAQLEVAQYHKHKVSSLISLMLQKEFFQNKSIIILE